MYTPFTDPLSEIAHIEGHFHELNDQNDTFFQWKKAVLAFQRQNSPVYQAFKGFEYLPVQAFKDAKVCCFDPELAAMVFQSSGTSGQSRSNHFVKSLDVYQRAIYAGFVRHFGSEPVLFLAHLPSYEKQSSLVYMANYLVNTVGVPGSGLFLENADLLYEAIEISKDTHIPIVLLGASFGLLDLVENNRIALPKRAKVIETGGMKTHRREMRREEIHERLATGFGIERSQLHSEYGMCELMSQCYSGTDGVFMPPPWVEAKVLSTQDFCTELPIGQEGVLALFDMANLYSQSSILTQDRAILRKNGFELLGRLDGAEIRGCNLLLER